jgi:hypothetical protein
MEEMLENYLLVAEAEGCERTEKAKKPFLIKRLGTGMAFQKRI